MHPTRRVLEHQQQHRPSVFCCLSSFESGLTRRSKVYLFRLIHAMSVFAGFPIMRHGVRSGLSHTQYLVACIFYGGLAVKILEKRYLLYRYDTPAQTSHHHDRSHALRFHRIHPRPCCVVECVCRVLICSVCYPMAVAIFVYFTIALTLAILNRRPNETECLGLLPPHPAHACYTLHR